MAIDDGLRPLLHSHIRRAHWQAIESGAMGTGTPDSNGCLDGVEVWCECKATSAWAVTFQRGQVGWAERRIRAGGRVFLLTRRHTIAGPRKGAAVDELWVHFGTEMRVVEALGLREGPPPILKCGGGPARWRWDELERLLFGSSAGLDGKSDNSHHRDGYAE